MSGDSNRDAYVKANPITGRPSQPRTGSNAVPWGAIAGAALVVIAFALIFSQEGKPLIMFSEETVLIGFVLAALGGGASWIGPKRWWATVLVVVFAVVAMAAAAYDIAMYEQAVNELQRELSNL